MGELSELQNIGKELERQLNEAGIETYEELKNMGAEQVWLEIHALSNSLKMKSSKGSDYSEVVYCNSRNSIRLKY